MSKPRCLNSLSVAKVHPRASPLPPFLNPETETFTVWMKSLLYHSNGFTVFNSNGDVAYRVDNYETKCSNEVHLMDLGGQTLFSIILKKKLHVFGRWEGYRWSGSDMDEKPFFKARKLMGGCSCQITDGSEKYRILKKAAGAPFRIINFNGDTVAEAKQKLSSSGVVLGDDVLSLEVKTRTRTDSSFIMAMLIVHGLINHQL